MIRLKVEDYFELLERCVLESGGVDSDREWHPEDIAAYTTSCMETITTMANWLNERELSRRWNRQSDLHDPQAGEMLR